MVGDLSTFESMAQRFGRVNRYGARDDARIDVVYPASFDQKDKLTPARQATLKLLQQLNGDASPKAIGELPADQRLAAFAPIPTTLPATDILFDAWALTTIREKMPGRPHVEPYLHGIAEWQPPETNVAWRDEVWKLHRPFDRVSDRRDFERFAAELLDDYPLKPHELLHDRSKRVFEQLEILARKHPDKPVWVLDGDGAVEVTTLERLADTQRRDRVNDCTVLLPPNAGGLSGGMLDGSVEPPAAGSLDVADEWEHESGVPFRKRIQSDETQPTGMRLIRSIELSGDDEDDDNPLTWDWYSRVPEGSRTASKPVSWETHVADVVNHAKRIVPGLSLPHEIADAIILAAEFHDHGKRRERSQLTLGNARYPHVVLAKSGRRGGLLPEPFRHEFGSVLDAQGEARINNLPDQMKDLVLHLIAAHHGRARPHFPRGEDFDPERAMADAEELAIETPRRFARLQRKYGRWGLAYLESLLRAADWAASAEPSAYLDD
jgi:CRISPR-associated endonuclease/helicase Cas3